MSEEQLRSLGESLNIKGAKKMDLPTLGFAILDTQAVNESKNPTPKAEPKQPKKRGRPRKDASASAEVKAPATAEIKETSAKAEKPVQEKAEPEEKPQPKKRGLYPLTQWTENSSFMICFRN